MINSRCISIVTGQKKCNINALKDLGVTCHISIDDSLSRQEIIINGEKVNVFKIIGDSGI